MKKKDIVFERDFVNFAHQFIIHLKMYRQNYIAFCKFSQTNKMREPTKQEETYVEISFCLEILKLLLGESECSHISSKKTSGQFKFTWRSENERRQKFIIKLIY